MATDRFGIGTTARRPISYPDPTGDMAATRVDRERMARAGANPDAALHAADTYLPPLEYANAEIERTSYMRDEHGRRQSISPWYDPAWHKRRRARPISNADAAAIIRALAPHLAT